MHFFFNSIVLGIWYVLSIYYFLYVFMVVYGLYYIRKKITFNHNLNSRSEIYILSSSSSTAHTFTTLSLFNVHILKTSLPHVQPEYSHKRLECNSYYECVCVSRLYNVAIARLIYVAYRIKEDFMRRFCILVNNIVLCTHPEDT